MQEYQLHDLEEVVVSVPNTKLGLLQADWRTEMVSVSQQVED